MKIDNIDKVDTAILSELVVNARVSQVELAERVGLSSTAIARRQKVLEEEGFIRGYQAVLDLARFGLSTTVPRISDRTYHIFYITSGFLSTITENSEQIEQSCRRNRRMMPSFSRQG